MESYTVFLVNDRLRSYNRLGLMIIFINGIFGAYFLWYNLPENNFPALTGGILTAALGLLMNFSSWLINGKPKLPFSVLFILFALQWLLLNNYWLPVVFLVLAFFDHVARQKQAVVFLASHIEIIAFPKKTIPWTQLNNAILKDNILTLDFKDDRLVQAEIASESFGIAEENLNDFCQLQLSASLN